MICAIIQSGAPALANDLCGALGTLVVEYNTTLNELTQLKAEVKEKDSEASE
jgi:hypothetical protein